LIKQNLIFLSQSTPCSPHSPLHTQPLRFHSQQFIHSFNINEHLYFLFDIHPVVLEI
jgi:hypothetical protein